MATTSAPRSGYATDARTPSLPLAPPRTHIPGHQRRQSRFTEMENDNRPTPPPPMDEYTPAHSIATNTERETDTDSESEDEGSPAGRRRSRSSWGIALRVLNGCVHGVACVLLLYIMVGFLKEMGGTWYKIMRYRLVPPVSKPKSQVRSILAFLAKGNASGSPCELTDHGDHI